MENNKLNFTDFNLNVNTETVPVEWNDHTIEIKKYLPIQEKLDLITRIVNYSLDDNNFANPMRKKIFFTLEMIYAYTNIEFTDEEKDAFLDTYDKVISSGLWDTVIRGLDSEEDERYDENDYWQIRNTVNAVINEIYQYKNSALGILQAISEDYKNLDLDASKIEEKISNKENLEFLHNVMEKLG